MATDFSTYLIGQGCKDADTLSQDRLVEHIDQFLALPDVKHFSTISTMMCEYFGGLPLNSKIAIRTYLVGPFLKKRFLQQHPVVTKQDPVETKQAPIETKQAPVVTAEVTSTPSSTQAPLGSKCDCKGDAVIVTPDGYFQCVQHMPRQPAPSNQCVIRGCSSVTAYTHERLSIKDGYVAIVHMCMHHMKMHGYKAGVLTNRGFCESNPDTSTSPVRAWCCHHGTSCGSDYCDRA
jgi:hypothetical protein